MAWLLAPPLWRSKQAPASLAVAAAPRAVVRHDMMADADTAYLHGRRPDETWFALGGCGASVLSQHVDSSVLLLRHFRFSEL